MTVRITVLAAAALLFCQTARGQYSIIIDQKTEAVDDGNVESMFYRRPVEAKLQNDYFDRAAWKAERRRIRLERNLVEFNATLQTSLQQFENWTAGGNNTFSGLTTLFFHHQFKKSRFTLDYSFNARYGMNVIDHTTFKNVDEFKFSLLSSWIMHGFWSYSASLNLRSQFSPGYKSREDMTKISDFMSPGYFDVAAGFTYHRDGSPFTFTLSPISGNLITMLNYKLTEQKNYGVDPGKKVESQIGPSVNISFDREFGRKKWLRYRSNFYTFTNLTTFPTVRWENTVDIKVTKFLTTTLYGLVYYLKTASTRLQYQYSFTVGIAYNFNNQNKK